MAKNKSSDIFNYDFDWYEMPKKKSKGETKEVCCEKYKNKKEKKCKSCPKRIA